MALQLGALHEALKAAGVGDDLARRAAEEVAAYENRLAAIERQIVELRADLNRQFAELRAYVDVQVAGLRAEVRILRWMVGTVLGLVIAVLVKLFVHG